MMQNKYQSLTKVIDNKEGTEEITVVLQPSFMDVLLNRNKRKVYIKQENRWINKETLEPASDHEISYFVREFSQSLEHIQHKERAVQKIS